MILLLPVSFAASVLAGYGAFGNRLILAFLAIYGPPSLVLVLGLTSLVLLPNWLWRLGALAVPLIVFTVTYLVFRAFVIKTPYVFMTEWNE